MSDQIEAKLDVIISLLAKSTIGAQEIMRIVTYGKRKGKPADFIRAYNQLGDKTITELADMIGISQPGLSSVISTWEKSGIIYNTGTANAPKYKGVIKLPEDIGLKKDGVEQSREADNSLSVNQEQSDLPNE